MRVLDIEVPDGLLERWAGWFSPALQPFLADERFADIDDHAGDVELSDEVRDTYCLYGLPHGVRYLWLSETQFMALPRARRAALVRAQRTLDRELVPSVRSWESVVGDRVRTQADGHRFVWWPSLLAGYEEEVLRTYVEAGRRASRHEEISDAVWDSVAETLPGARRIAGTFPTGSGPNCFGAVMAAAGVVGADAVWMQREPFERWLSDMTRPGGENAAPGTVLVWRSPDGLVQHAAVTLGQGWALHKPSQGWVSPTKVLTIAEVLASSREVGRQLERHRLT